MSAVRHAEARAFAVAAAFLASGLYALLLEALQIPVPGRYFEWWDVAADLAGEADPRFDAQETRRFLEGLNAAEVSKYLDVLAGTGKIRTGRQSRGVFYMSVTAEPHSANA